MNQTVLRVLMAISLVCSSALTAAQTPQAIMSDCAAQAGGRKGSERKQFMTDCLAPLNQTGKPLGNDPCAGGSANDAIRCSAGSWGKSEQELNTAYRELRTRLRKDQFQHLEPRLIQAQREWLKFRDLHCSFSAAVEVESNSWNSYWEQSCKASEAQARTQYLRSVLP
jgi:uncharacterized protein YecT (DUF1311 family)